MNYAVLILFGFAYICSSFAFSAEFENTQEISPVVVAENSSLGVKKAKKNRKTIFNRLQIPESKPRSCQEALDQSIAEKSGELDLSLTSDFAQNGLAAIQAFLEKIKETNSFGTYSKNLAVDLSQTNLSPEIISTLIEWAKAESWILILNLSYNKSVGDNVIDAIRSFSNVYSLILRGTSVSDATVAKINAILTTEGIGALHSLDISETNVSKGGAKSLEELMRKALEVQKIQNPNSSYDTERTGVVYEENPFAKITRKSKAKNPGLTLNPPILQPQTVEQEISLEKPQEIIPSQETIVEKPEPIVLPEQEISEPTTQIPLTNPDVSIESADMQTE